MRSRSRTPRLSTALADELQTRWAVERQYRLDMAEARGRGAAGRQARQGLVRDVLHLETPAHNILWHDPSPIRALNRVLTTYGRAHVTSLRQWARDATPDVHSLVDDFTTGLAPTSIEVAARALAGAYTGGPNTDPALNAKRARYMLASLLHLREFDATVRNRTADPVLGSPPNTGAPDHALRANQSWAATVVSFGELQAEERRIIVEQDAALKLDVIDLAVVRPDFSVAGPTGLV